MVLNCVNCGAPIETDKKVCPYYKTPYDVSGFKAEIGEMFFGEITIGGKTSRVYLENVERNQLLIEPYCDAMVFCIVRFQKQYANLL